MQAKGLVRKAFGVVLLATVTHSSAVAQSEQAHRVDGYGAGHSYSVYDLPEGNLRSRLESLPPKASKKALRWLQGFSFPRADLDTLRIDNSGNLVYADTILPDTAHAKFTQQSSKTEQRNTAAMVLDDAFRLHSKPGAPNVLFIDFDGAIITQTAWNDAVPRFDALAYDLDGNADAFNDNERLRIAEIWHQVAEDYAPFDIDVTTEEPAEFDINTGHVLITHDVDANGELMPNGGGAGTAYVNVFGTHNYISQFSPSLVYYSNLDNGNADYVAASTSHEFGHTVGLSHDGNSKTTGQDATYYGGHGTGEVSWAPIMGAAYNKSVTQWSNGDYNGGNQTEDDLQIIAQHLGYRADDHGNSIAKPSSLVIDPDGMVISSNPELDPHNVLGQNKGYVGRPGDLDVFVFTVSAGTVDLSVTPAWDAFSGPAGKRGANLDIKAKLTDQNGSLVALSSPIDDTDARINVVVGAGTYYLSIRGVGNPITPYSTYGSLGTYFINGTVSAAQSVDTTPPSPTKMTWASVPEAISDSVVAMTATTATDDTSAVQYKFICVSGGLGCVSSPWQSSPAYTAQGLVPSTLYTFRVKARDVAGNKTSSSNKGKATTMAASHQQTTVKHFATGETLITGALHGNYTATHDDDSVAEWIREQLSSGSYSTRYSQLEHLWNFSISAGTTVTVYANSKSSGSQDGDTFNFEYSLDGGNSFQPLFNVSSTKGANTQSAIIPGAPQGAITVRVIDTDRSAGKSDKDSVLIDQLYIEVASS